MALAVGALLVYGTLGLPEFSDPDAPIHQHVVPRYLKEMKKEVDVPNVVTAVLASYRGYDTLGETHCGVYGRRRRPRAAAAPSQGQRTMRYDLVVRVIAKLLIPFVLLFGLYVQFHGDFGPGGGFQAGVILAAAVIFYGLIYGLDDARKVVPERLVESMMAVGVLLYAGVGIAGILLGGNYLDYFVLDRDPVLGQHRGIFWVEVGVAITVSGVMLKIFYHVCRARPGG